MPRPGGLPEPDGATHDIIGAHSHVLTAGEDITAIATNTEAPLETAAETDIIARHGLSPHSDG